MKEISMLQVNDACFKIAARIRELSPEQCRLAAVARGGLVPATIIAHYLGIKDISFIRLSSYDNQKNQSAITDTTTDKISNEADTYIIDDICDSGETLKYLRQKYPQARIFTLINKNPQLKPDFAPLSEQPQEWINFPWEVAAL